MNQYRIIRSSASKTLKTHINLKNMSVEKTAPGLVSVTQLPSAILAQKL